MKCKIIVFWTLVMVVFLVCTSTCAKGVTKDNSNRIKLDYRKSVNELTDRNLYFKFHDIDSYYNESTNQKNTDYIGLKVTWYGDSLTDQYFFCRKVDSYFGFIGNNSGISDTTVANINDSSMCKEIRMTYQDASRINDTSDIIFIMAGVNDWMLNIEMGDPDSTYANTVQGILEDKTFAGAANQMFYYLEKNYPDARIIVLGTPYCSGAHYDAFDTEDKSFNDLGYSSLDYGRMLCKIAAMWGVENINVGDNLDWNKDNILQYSEDGIHFNEEEGSTMVAQVIIDYLESLN